jgi:metal-sulfur cluster biosynthetic enzyme
MSETNTNPNTDLRAWPTEEPADAGATAQPGRFALPVEDDGMPSEADIRESLKAVMDPEIGINIVDLGLVYDVVKADGRVALQMTLTSMGCPLTELIHQQCTLVLTRLPGVETVDVDFVFSPPWSTDMISDEARDELRAMGFNV